MENFPLPEPYKIKSVEAIKLLSKDERVKKLKEAGNNTFALKAEDVFIDLLTDSGTNAMSDLQWAAIMRGDEAYAGSKSFYEFEAAVQKYYGLQYIVPAHQGRAAEHLLSKALIKENQYVLGSMNFISTKIHQMLLGAKYIEVINDVAFELVSSSPFKANIDLEKLESNIEKYGAENIAYFSICATAEWCGGQPVSLANIKAAAAICKQHNVLVGIDATRLIENIYFIKQREEGQRERTIPEILYEFCSYADFITMSAKKDLLVNIGGFVACRNEEIFHKLKTLAITYEGLHTYGGLAGRDLLAMAQGLKEAVQFDTVRNRIEQVAYLANKIKAAGVPILEPVGGHCVVINAGDIYAHIPQSQYPAQAFTNNLYIASGIRANERGAFSSGRDMKTGKELFPANEIVRLTIPRRVYTQSHLDYVANAIIYLFENRQNAKGMKIVEEPKEMRFIASKLEFLD